MQLEVLPTFNRKVLLVKDISLWSSLPVDNIILEVKVPGRDEYKRFLINKGDLKVLNCSDLSFCKGGMTDLPDGTYRMKLSYNPNEDTITEFYHFRDVELRGKLFSTIKELLDNKCELSKKDFSKKQEELIKIDLLLRAAKYQVEECGDPQGGKDLYSQVMDELENYSNCDC